MKGLLADLLGALLCCVMTSASLVVMLLAMLKDDDLRVIGGLLGVNGFGLLGIAFCRRGLSGNQTP